MRAATTEVTYRRARPEDVPGIDAVVAAADAGPAVTPAAPGDASDAPGFLPGTQAAYLTHLVGRPKAAVAVATDPDDAIVAFAAAVETGRAVHLADLFVHPERQGQGIGRRLLEDVFGESHGRPFTTFASDDPRALPIYVRAGMAAWWPNLYLAGDPGGLPTRGPDEPEVVTTTLATIAEHERRWAGVDRDPELAYWSTLAGGQALVARHDGTIVGVGFVRDRLSGPGRWLDHAVVAPGADGATVLLAIARAGWDGAELAGASVPGPSGLVPVLLRAGFTIRDRDTFLASDPSVVDAAREVVNTGFL